MMSSSCVPRRCVCMACNSAMAFSRTGSNVSEKDRAYLLISGGGQLSLQELPASRHSWPQAFSQSPGSLLLLTPRASF